MQKVFEANNLITIFHGFNNMNALWFLIHLKLTSSFFFFFFDHSKLVEFACSGERKDTKLFLYLLIGMLTAMKAKKLQMQKQ